MKCDDSTNFNLVRELIRQCQPWSAWTQLDLQQEILAKQRTANDFPNQNRRLCEKSVCCVWCDLGRVHTYTKKQSNFLKKCVFHDGSRPTLQDIETTPYHKVLIHEWKKNAKKTLNHNLNVSCESVMSRDGCLDVITTTALIQSQNLSKFLRYAMLVQMTMILR